jgi:hypothetical protein
MVHELLLDRCKTVADIKVELPTCVDAAVSMFDKFILSEEDKKKILKMLSESLFPDEE